MNFTKRFVITLGLVAVAGLTAATAGAATISRGTFTLPEKAYWGSTLLPAGDYTMILDKELSGVHIFSVNGEGVKAAFMAPAGPEETSSRSCLKIDNVNGTYVIREFDAGYLGKSYKFGVAKAVRNMTLSGTAKPVTIPVSVNGGE